jgi:hypothetical protein
MKFVRLLAVLPALVLPALCPAQQIVSISTELSRLADFGLLPVLVTGVEAQISTYDRTGANDDGFNGTYSFFRRNKDSSLVMLDLDGPGEINRIATPTPTEDTLDFYFDGESKPKLSIYYPDLFSGKRFPFVAPLSGAGAGGYFCYFPILFQRHCTIVCRGKKLQFHQVQYRLFPKGTRVETFTSNLDDESLSKLNQVRALWGASGRMRKHFLEEPAQQTVNVSRMMQPGESVTLADISTGGRIKGIRLDGADRLSDSAANCWLRVTLDGENKPAIDCPVSDFFGYVSGKPSMAGLLMGADSGTAYCYLPMPFDRSAKVELMYKGQGKPIQIQSAIDYVDRRRDSVQEGKLHARYTINRLGSGDPYHVFLAVRGKGHYVGTILYAEGVKRPSTLYFEGDDSLATDGVFRIHGTGSEDYFNGGWYALPGRWDSARSFPLSGCLYYTWNYSGTGGYRFYDLDKVPFDREIWMGIEHGPDPGHRIDARYRSVALYYKQ